MELIFITSAPFLQAQNTLLPFVFVYVKVHAKTFKRKEKSKCPNPIATN